MRAFVFTEPALTSRAGQFVWLEMNIDDEKNASLLPKISVEALPSYYVVNPADDTIALRHVGAMTIAEVGAFLDDARRVLGGAPTSSPADAALLRADRLNAEGKKTESAAAYREALDAAPPAWSPYGRAVAALLFGYQTTHADATCVALAREALPRLSGSSVAVTVSTGGLDCALALDKSDPARASAIGEMEATLRRILADSGAGAAADDLSSGYSSLLEARRDAGDKAGAREAAAEWAAFLEAQAGAARTPEQRAVFDSHRLAAYLALEEPERAIPMLQASERDLPDDYNPPARLAVAYQAMKRLDEALAASDRALPRVTGPRRIRVLETRAEILGAKGEAASARGVLQDALVYAESLPAGQRSERTIATLKKKLAESESKDATGKR
jgi:tetratricopeptide (TPR) repeat protein